MMDSELLDIRKDYSFEEDLSAVRFQWPLVGIFRNPAGELFFRVSIRGIRGGQNIEHRLDCVDYLVEVRLPNFPQQCPEAWVIEPAAEHRHHFDVSKTTGKVCLSENEAWKTLWENGDFPLGVMSLVGFLSQLNYVLKNENTENPREW